MARRKNRLELRTAVRTNLDEAVASFWSDANVNQFLNTAKDRVWMEVRKADLDYFTASRTSRDGAQTIVGEAYDCANFRLVPTVRDYVLPPDFAEMTEIRSIATTYEWLRLMYRRHDSYDFRAALEGTDAATPRYYTVIGERTLRIAPLSDVTLDLLLTYVYLVPDLDADPVTLDMPHPLYKAVQEYATAEASR